ncbi:MAK10-like protein [Tanacetum coccineum]
MGDENPIRNLGDYSKPSHEGYMNTIELPVGNNVIPLRSDTIRLVQNGCSFYRLWSEDPYKHLKDFLKLVDSLDLDDANRERTRLREEERSEKTDVTTDDDFEKPTKIETEMPVKEVEKEDEAENELNKKAGKEETTRAPSSQPIEYYLKHKISKKLIEGHVGNHRGLVYEAILRKKITRKEDIRGNFEIPYNIGDLKHMNALVDQGSDINVMPLSTYMKITDERPAEIGIRLSLASHSYIYPLGIAEDVLVEVAEHVYPVDFVILDIKEDENRPFILETPFLTTTKAVIKFDKGAINLRSGKSKISFHGYLSPFVRSKEELRMT